MIDPAHIEEIAQALKPLAAALAEYRENLVACGFSSYEAQEMVLAAQESALGAE